MRGKWSENYVGFTTSSRHNPMMSPRKERLPVAPTETPAIGERGRGDVCTHCTDTSASQLPHRRCQDAQRDENLFGKEKETIHSRETANRAAILTRQTCAKPSENCFVFGSPYINNQLISFKRGKKKKKRKKTSKLDMQWHPLTLR